MKYRAEYLVEKRDGRIERFRALKLARSIHLALLRGQDPDPERSSDLAVSVVAGLARTRGRGRVTTTHDIAAAVEQVLRKAGCHEAARAYARTGLERRRRRALWSELVTDGAAGRCLVPRCQP